MYSYIEENTFINIFAFALTFILFFHLRNFFIILTAKLYWDLKLLRGPIKPNESYVPDGCKSKINYDLLCKTILANREIRKLKSGHPNRRFLYIKILIINTFYNFMNMLVLIVLAYHAAIRQQWLDYKL